MRTYCFVCKRRKGIAAGGTGKLLGKQIGQKPLLKMDHFKDAVGR